MRVKELAYEDCRNFCDDITFDCRSTEELTPLDEIIGQDRAVRALQFGLRVEKKGFNVYAAGMPGTGRRTAIVDFIRELSKDMPVADDWCYVNNFEDSTRPRALRLPAGKGREFRDQMDHFLEDARNALRETFEGEEYSDRRNETLQSIEERRNRLTQEINRIASDAGFQLQSSSMGLILVPVVDGQPLSQQEFAQLSEDHRRRIQEKRQEIQSEIQGKFRMLRDLEREAGEEIRELNRKVASYALEPYLSSMRDRFSESEDVVSFLEELEKDILENLQTFMGEQQAQVQQQAQGQQISQQQLRQAMQGDPMEKYRVNLIVDNSQTEGAPVEIEWNPSYIRLLGAIEKEPRFGALVTNFSLIRAGATHRANGGFLVIPVERLLMDPILWDSLKQVISTGELEIEEPAAKMGYMVTKTLRPEPIPFEAKVVLMGDPALYNLLYSRDRDFPELFKVKADFDTSMDRTDENIRQYASFICTLCNREELLHLDPAAIGAVIEHSSRLVEDKEKLSARFSEIADIIREANFYAVQDGSEVVGKEHIDRQLEERVYRSNLIQEKIQEMIERGSILIDTEGDKVGQVNGLAVYSSGDYVFGKPSRITASIGVGREGIVDIEREAEMGGPTHTKGVLILSGFLSQRYAGENPLSLSARLVFEQSYSGVDGDSASSTELYALLSALSGRPIRQDLAVTGSVNQKGDVQAIGGVNQKIEGFFEVCRAKGLTGDQGCVIPRSNVKNLMLKDEVLETIREGDFHIYPVDTIDEGISLLTGVEAGERREDGTYPEGSINHLVQRRLSQMADRIREFRDSYAD